MTAAMTSTTGKQPGLEELFRQHGFTDFRWIDPQRIVVSQWVRMKCMFGCGDYGKNASCPPNVPSVAECERFFREYQQAVVLHFQKQVEKPEDRHAWTRQVCSDLLKLERRSFSPGTSGRFCCSWTTAPCAPIARASGPSA